VAWAVAITAVSGLLVGEDPTPARQVLGLAVSVPVIIAVTYVFSRWVDRRGWDGIGLPVPRWQHLWQWGVGFGAGLLVIAGLFGIEWALGWVEVAGTALDDRGAGTAARLLAGGLALQFAVAFSEEIGFRGYVFQNLAGRLSVRNATLATGLLLVRRIYQPPQHLHQAGPRPRPGHQLPRPCGPGLPQLLSRRPEAPRRDSTACSCRRLSAGPSASVDASCPWPWPVLVA
jgi:hypothetical protein